MILQEELDKALLLVPKQRMQSTLVLSAPATAIAKNMVIGGTELGDVDKMYQTGKSAIKGSVGAARVGSDLVKDTVDTAKTTSKAFKAGLNGEDIDLSGTKSRSGSNLAKGTKKAAKEGFRAAKACRHQGFRT